jgi:serine/threonine protein kinase
MSPPLKLLVRDADATSALDHPSICVVHDVGEAAGPPFLVMELLNGKTLREHIGGTPLEISTSRKLSDLGGAIVCRSD